MSNSLSRRCFLKCAAAGAVSTSLFATLAGRLAMAMPVRTVPGTRTRVGRIYLGHTHPGWPSHTVDLPADVRAFEEEMAKLGSRLDDYEFVDAGLVRSAEELAQAKEKFRDVDGILLVQLTMGVGGQLQSLFELEKPIVIFALPYTGHEWHTIAGWQRQGKPVEVYPTSRHEDVLIALRPFRAIHRLREASILHVSQGPADAAYCAAVEKKFGTKIISLDLPDLQRAYAAADRSEALADAKRWMDEAGRIVEPTREEIVSASVMYVAMLDLLAEHQACAITMNCLGMGLMDRGMAYPCLGFVRLNNVGMAGVCEADLKSTMTQLLFTYLVGRTGFVTDPVVDLSTGSIIHAHCVAATQMLGPGTAASPYDIRSHLEDGRGVSLMVKMPVGQKVSMARLLGTEALLFSTGDAVDSPFVDRGCRSKLTMKVDRVEHFLENWSSGLHRVIFYGDHTRDIERYCRFARVRLLREGVDPLQQEDGLDWDPYVHA